MVTLQILVLSFQVRVLVAQQRESRPTRAVFDIECVRFTVKQMYYEIDQP